MKLAHLMGVSNLNRRIYRSDIIRTFRRDLKIPRSSVFRLHCVRVWVAGGGQYRNVSEHPK